MEMGHSIYGEQTKGIYFDCSSQIFQTLDGFLLTFSQISSKPTSSFTRFSKWNWAFRWDGFCNQNIPSMKNFFLEGVWLFTKKKEVKSFEKKKMGLVFWLAGPYARSVMHESFFGSGVFMLELDHATSHFLTREFLHRSNRPSLSIFGLKCLVI